jgi:hypothetical protein
MHVLNVLSVLFLDGLTATLVPRGEEDDGD